MTDPTRSDGAPAVRGPSAERIQLEVDGTQVELADEGITLLEALRDRLGVRSPKDGCSPQGQCGCCTVLVDGAPRVACVTPLRRVRGRAVTTVDGLAPEVRSTWAEAFTATGASQCGFCTPGIICRLEGARTKGAGADDRVAVDRALAAHLCRCTGWQPIRDAWDVAVPALSEVQVDPAPALRTGGAASGRDLDAAARRAALEGGAPQQVGPEVALGQGGFADDTAPDDALVAVPDGAGGWAVAETLARARAAAGKVQGRRTTVETGPPLELPTGDWDATLRTRWVEPAYLEPDAAWCRPGADPVGPLRNGGAFGGKRTSPVAAAARELADRHGRPVRVLLAREDVVRLGPKRPPVAGGARADGTGVLRVAATPGVAAAVSVAAPGLRVEEVALPGPPTSTDPRAAGWAEAHLLLAGATGRQGPVADPGGGRAEVTLDDDGAVHVRVEAGDPLDEVVLRSYCIGAVHQGLSWVRSEGLAVTPDGVVEDLTIRSFGILRAADMPPVTVEVVPTDAPAVRATDAVFVAAATAAWLAAGAPPDLPTGG
ncbi:2Fe-2S iron-sulfur cluster-binding protein [Iamia majanohamensis]|uniref:2Fe-2S iron-sulfur cluster-binding protein n=1 Tax=Iamia majanohamensis TaxID=467976 RepID=A0AAF0BVN9_9ACTN|nr:2Fe-2S iron-sulfur cluster-binding protein [Iamia majanohamensis]WCO66564.1 2Fe-2S iron-sulfur cluster-binding protein [Iamia majanohamensis]